jgi:Flp pilus assembly pilin Flp
MAHSPRRLLEDQTGAAMTEALICTPVFAAILAGVVAFHGIYAAKLEAKSRARRLAWLQADSGRCPAQSCLNDDCGRAEAEVRAGGLDGLSRVRDTRFSLASFVGDVGRYFLGRVTHGIGVAATRMPSMVDPAAGFQRGATALLCNTTMRHAEAGGSVLEHACRAGLRTTEYAGEVCN